MESPTKTDETQRVSEYVIDRKNAEIDFLQRRIEFIRLEQDALNRKIAMAEIVLGVLMFSAGFYLGWRYGLS